MIFELVVGVIDEDAGEAEEVGDRRGWRATMRRAAVRARPAAAGDQAEREGAGGDQGERQLPQVGEDRRREEAGEQAAGGPAGGDQQVEAGQSPRLGLEPHELAVADHAGDEQGAEVGGELEQHRRLDALAQDHRGAGGADQQQRGSTRRGGSMRSYSKHSTKLSR